MADGDWSQFPLLPTWACLPSDFHTFLEKFCLLLFPPLLIHLRVSPASVVVRGTGSRLKFALHSSGGKSEGLISLLRSWVFPAWNKNPCWLLCQWQYSSLLLYPQWYGLNLTSISLWSHHTMRFSHGQAQLESNGYQQQLMRNSVLIWENLQGRYQVFFPHFPVTPVTPEQAVFAEFIWIPYNHTSKQQSSYLPYSGSGRLYS